MADAVDAALSAADEERLRAHCSGCAQCRELLDDLRDIRETAASLDRRQPPALLRDVIRAQVRGAFVGRDEAPARTRWQPRVLTAAASIVLMIAAASWIYFARIGQPGTQPADASAQLANAASELQLAEQHYSNAIAALEKLTADKQAKLDPQVADAITQSLSTIDKAIGDSRAALKAQPDSIVAQTSLLEALRMKVSLLQETVSLMNAHS